MAKEKLMKNHEGRKSGMVVALLSDLSPTTLRILKHKNKAETIQGSASWKAMELRDV